MSRFFRVVFSDTDRDDRFFASHEAAHVALTRDGFVIDNPSWPDTWRKVPFSDLPSYSIRAHGEYIEVETV
jgi:hypothetical protein